VVKKLQRQDNLYVKIPAVRANRINTNRVTLMPKGNEFWSRDFASRYGHTKLVEDKDKYLFATEPPRYRFNVIGTGTMGLEHIQVTLFEGRATIHGIYDPEPLSVANAKTAFARYSDGPLKIYESLEAACNDPDVDGVIICTPNFTHIDVVRVAAKSGKHILVEKPVATTIPDAYEIAQIADAYDGIFQVGLQYRYKAIYTEAIHEALERKTLGRQHGGTSHGVSRQDRAVEQVFAPIGRYAGRKVLSLFRFDQSVCTVETPTCICIRQHGG